MKINLIVLSCILILIATKCDGKAIRFIRDLKNNSTTIKEAPVALTNVTELRPIAVPGIGIPSSGPSIVGRPGSYSTDRAVNGELRPSVSAAGPGAASWPSGRPLEAGIPSSYVSGQSVGPGSWPSGRPVEAGILGSYVSGQADGSAPGSLPSGPLLEAGSPSSYSSVPADNRPTGMLGYYGPPGMSSYYVSPTLNTRNNFNTDGYKLCIKQKLVASNDFAQEIPICVIIAIPEYTPSSYAVQRQF